MTADRSVDQEALLGNGSGSGSDERVATPGRRSFREKTRQRLRESVLDAFYEQVIEVGWKQVRLADVAEQVGISRQTIYNEFGSKEAIGQELVLRETDEFLDGTLRRLEAHREDLPLGVAAAATFALRRAEENRLLRAILVNARGGEDDMLPLLTTRSEPILRVAAEVLTDFITEQWPTLDRVEVAMGAESVVRLIVSHMVLPLHSVAETAAHVSLVVERYLRLPPVGSGQRADVVQQAIAATEGG